MTKARLEAFSDGVIAILITILVLELKIPHGAQREDLMPLLPVFLAYVLSFIYLGIYWSNHHHLLHTVTRVSAGIMWANLHLMFWLSLVPFTTAWMGENHFAALPTALYGLVMLCAATAFRILGRTIIATDGQHSTLGRAIGADYKVYFSMLIYATAMLMAFYATWVSHVLYVVVALMWLIPDRRIERTLAE